MRFLLIALLGLVAITSARADDPPFLVAAREREKKAKAFEATWNYVETIQGMEMFAPKRERIDVVTTGRGSLQADGVKWWYKTDPDSTPWNLPSNGRNESSFNGIETFVEWGSQVKFGLRNGQWDFTRIKSEGEERWPWPEFASPLRTVFRASHRESFLSPREGYSPWEPVGSTLQPIGERMCQEYQRQFRDQPARERLWVDPATDQLPVRYERSGSTTVNVDYKPHPVLGWVPTSWTMTSGRPPSLHIRHTKVKLDFFDLRESISDERFSLTFPVGSQVRQITQLTNGVKEVDFVVAEDGLLVEVKPKAEPTPAQPELPSLHRSLWVVGVAVAGFVAFAVLVKWVARRSPEPPFDGRTR